ncbi:hypothetical protein SCP_0309540 [Sparassis crispa]|uniref:Uncharacterized protein n=1 Tax=Sparassis crispa TaxID=139825 RepID=A0A401GGA8_9APHY|nr:hypothetical protein SCP_0309540 [Sparassis crispa]GBE81227.1 hypothetical protein SCP_0309540 [Sparassis crispa]
MTPQVMQTSDPALFNDAFLAPNATQQATLNIPLFSLATPTPTASGASTGATSDSVAVETLPQFVLDAIAAAEATDSDPQALAAQEAARADGDRCIASGRSCTPDWIARPEMPRCCPGLTCYAVILAVGGWCG